MCSKRTELWQKKTQFRRQAINVSPRSNLFEPNRTYSNLLEPWSNPIEPVRTHSNSFEPTRRQAIVRQVADCAWIARSPVHPMARSTMTRSPDHPIAEPPAALREGSRSNRFEPPRTRSNPIEPDRTHSNPLEPIGRRLTRQVSRSGRRTSAIRVRPARRPAGDNHVPRIRNGSRGFEGFEGVRERLGSNLFELRTRSNPVEPIRTCSNLLELVRTYSNLFDSLSAVRVICPRVSKNFRGRTLRGQRSKRRVRTSRRPSRSFSKRTGLWQKKTQFRRQAINVCPRSNLFEPTRTQSNLFEPTRTQSNPLEPPRTCSNPLEPIRSRSNRAFLRRATSENVAIQDLTPAAVADRQTLWRRQRRRARSAVEDDRRGWVCERREVRTEVATRHLRAGLPHPHGGVGVQNVQHDIRIEEIRRVGAGRVVT